MVWPFARRVPYIPQMEATECGAACLAMVAAYHGHFLPLAEARVACEVSRDGSSALAITRAGRKIGFTAEGLRLDRVEDLSELPLPAILHWGLTHFVVLDRVETNGLSLVDPGVGKRLVSWEEARDGFTGIALCFEPGAGFRRRRATRSSLRRYASVVRASAARLTAVLVAALLMELVSLLIPAGNQALIDWILREHQTRWLLPLGITMCAAVVAKLLLYYVRQRISFGIRAVLDVALMGRFVDHLLRLPLSFFQQRSPGDVVTRVQGNIAIWGLSSQIINALLDGFLVVGYTALVAAYNVRVGMVIACAIVVRAVVIGLTAPRLQEDSTRETLAFGRESNTTFEAFTSPEATKAMGAEPLLLHRHTTRLVERLNAREQRYSRVERIEFALRLVDAVMGGAVLLLSGTAVLEDRMTVGVFASLLLLLTLLAHPMHSFFAALQQLSFLSARLSTLDDVLDTATEADGASDPGPFRGAIDVENVSFQYGLGSPLVLDKVSLRADAGETVAIVGPSGAGKSTLAMLLLGLARPTSGTVRLDGIDLASLRLSRVRAAISAVTQDPALFDATVRDNISLHDEAADIADVRAAAKLACFHEVVETLPRHYETVLGGRAKRLSGGERQRLALARALSRGAKVLVLDEATSALDLPLEKRLQGNLDGLDCTRIVIAHRLATVRSANRIVVLDGGRVAQTGSYDELASTPGLFRSMLETMA